MVNMTTARRMVAAMMLDMITNVLWKGIELEPEGCVVEVSVPRAPLPEEVSSFMLSSCSKSKDVLQMDLMGG